MGIVALLALGVTACQPKLDRTNYEAYPIYMGSDLELTYTAAQSQFRLWAPTATQVKLHIYAAGEGGSPESTYEMKRSEKGTWLYKLNGDFKGKFYTFQVTAEEKELAETPGVWVKAVGVNGNRAAIIELLDTNPEGWEVDVRPPLAQYTDIVIYELHHRDLSISPTSGNLHKGKFLALTEQGTKSPQGLTTGLDHIKELGITHVHLLPSYDLNSIDEAKLEENRYNWGYDPKNYNAVDGSYSTDPHNPVTRIREFKQMVQSLHKSGIRVIMDVVYNHTAGGDDSNFSLTVPGYFYRYNADGSYSDASGCGNETASERAMVRRYMVESVKYWATEYRIDGFRFDLMGIHDIETMNEIRKALDEIDPTIFVYGEGWTAAGSPLPESLRALKVNGKELPRIAMFSDDIRDGLRGNWQDGKVPGFASGQPGFAQSIRFGVVGATEHPQVDYSKLHYTKASYANNPDEVINYVSCHDDPCLRDKLTETLPEGATEAELQRFNKLAQTVVFTSQGVPFIYAGEEIYRTKQGVHNTYQSPDSINQIDWSFKSQYADLYNYNRNLIALRKAYPAFRMMTQQEVAERVLFIETNDDLVVAYRIIAKGNQPELLVIYNGKRDSVEVNVPAANRNVLCFDGKIDLAGVKQEAGDRIRVPASSAWIGVTN